MAAIADDISINTLIGSGSFIRGDMRIAGFIRIDGDLDGNLETTGRVIVGEKARIRGDIRSLVITIGGIVQGDVIAPEGVNILSTGVVLGTVITRKLVMEDSVLFSGSCFAVNDQDLFDAALSEYNNRKALSRSLASAARSQI